MKFRRFTSLAVLLFIVFIAGCSRPSVTLAVMAITETPVTIQPTIPPTTTPTRTVTPAPTPTAVKTFDQTLLMESYALTTADVDLVMPGWIWAKAGEEIPSSDVAWLLKDTNDVEFFGRMWSQELPPFKVQSLAVRFQNEEAAKSAFESLSSQITTEKTFPLVANAIVPSQTVSGKETHSGYYLAYYDGKSLGVISFSPNKDISEYSTVEYLVKLARAQSNKALK